ncbi:Trp biosynthesis-associated membrane protein [Micromonospora lupini]|uniref:Trp biosynthesis associated, transmembrane protein, Oprn/Chp n=1 Tax=Micromonospora lupini str. Lupac 08 TaxID=1150864 RepID=I0L8Q0_9ACTN|nr:Trp biosynthesis-associated membrane protein [Micromonospora lupini]CCH20197.1 Trp biosynthesis associated, transmembrane protein, Oprn/Chp [Micromonospora lupini str. Lupac 08]
MSGGGRAETGARGVEGRRQLTYAMLLCLAGAGLALWAATRGWSVEVTARPAPLPPVRDARSGAALLPWLPALALVTLAGGGAVLATRGRVRRLLGVLLGALGLVVAAGGAYGLVADLDGVVSRQWPALCLLGGLLAAVGGGWTALRGGGWPAMGARYERPTRTVTESAPTTVAPPGRMAGRRTTEAWDALDRGEDPTAG